jgi:hypothetical protein
VGDIGCQTTEQDDVWADQNVLTLVFGSVTVDIFVVNVVQCVNPTTVINRNEVDKFVGENGHWVTFSYLSVWPCCEECYGGLDWWVGLWVSAHVAPKARWCLDGTRNRNVAKIRQQQLAEIHRNRFAIASVSDEERVDVGEQGAFAERKPDLS